MYKVILKSADADETKYSATYATRVFRNVNIPFDTIKGNARIFVDFFAFNTEEAPQSYPFSVDIDEIAQPLSFDTTYHSTTKSIKILDTSTFHNHNSDYGISMQDLNLFRTRTLSVSIKSFGSDDLSAVPWILTLGIVQLEENVNKM
jgi:hypothetical protein